MNQAVARADDLVPGNLGVRRLHGFGNPGGRFADDLNQLQQGKEEHAVRLDVRARPILGKGNGFLM